MQRGMSCSPLPSSLLLAYPPTVDVSRLISQIEFVEKIYRHRMSLHGVRAKQMLSWKHGSMRKSPNPLA